MPKATAETQTEMMMKFILKNPKNRLGVVVWGYYGLDTLDYSGASWSIILKLLLQSQTFRFTELSLRTKKKKPLRLSTRYFWNTVQSHAAFSRGFDAAAFEWGFCLIPSS